MPNAVLKREATGGWSRVAVKKALHKGVPAASGDRFEALVALVWGVVQASRDSRPKPFDEVVGELAPRISMLLGDAPCDEDAAPSAWNIRQGKGLGEKLGAAEGERRLAAFARARPIEEWAGPVRTAGELEAELDIKRTTLSAWRNGSVAVGFKRDRRNYVYPLEQFIDARPVDGLKAVLDLAPDARSAWLWLRQPNAGLDGIRPIDGLRAGDTETIAAAARRSFG